MSIEKKSPDLWLFMAIILLMAVGLCMVFSSSYIMAYKWYGDSYYFLKRQLIYSMIALIAFFFAIYTDYHYYKKYSLPILILSIALLSMVYIPGIGRTAGGASRWIKIGFFSFQPSEIAKFALILYMAESLTRKQVKDIKTFIRGVLPTLIIMLVMFLLILYEPDFSTSLIILGISFIMLFIGGTRVIQLYAIIVAAIPLGILILSREEYRKVRLLSFLDPWKDPLDSGFHIIQSLLALGSGGIFGIGLAESKQKYFYLPDQHTDFIFSIIGEELGFIGTVVIIILFTILLWRGFKIALDASDQFGTLLAAGITSMIVFQSIINIGVVTKMIPTTGITLPFISYGGSSLIVNMFCGGILLNISRYKAIE
ncbi:cell division protein FtsW [Candidatus Atribacteria bacterium RBG_19FT_COMBO_35_14]|uniref:Probable peptidoglycan glycosyltransferase FtsW n=1 Tax=Candidatus Sediminicultor quintus TaxID=1797291 RepID=A0A1F5ABS0_9BACT|nr:MAG: cell division protein FtsW [Candidatus Atribacteria bacterium RBG_19FT_COMBO_35_14]